MNPVTPYTNRTELQACLEISRLANMCRYTPTLMEAIFTVASRIPGVSRVWISAIATAEEFGATAIHVRSPVRTERRLYGELHMKVEAPVLHIDDPLRLVRFVAQQLGAMLRLHELRQRRIALNHEMSQLQKALMTAKLLPRAQAALANRLMISEPRALHVLEEYSKDAGLPLLITAKRIVREHTVHKWWDKSRDSKNPCNSSQTEQIGGLLAGDNPVFSGKLVGTSRANELPSQ